MTGRPSNKSRGSTLPGLIPGFPRFYLKFLENLSSISSVCIGVQLELSQGVTLLVGRLLLQRQRRRGAALYRQRGPVSPQNTRGPLLLDHSPSLDQFQGFT